LFDAPGSATQSMFEAMRIPFLNDAVFYCSVGNARIPEDWRKGQKCDFGLRSYCRLLRKSSKIRHSF
jgi:hypothetical protein